MKNSSSFVLLLLLVVVSSPSRRSRRRSVEGMRTEGGKTDTWGFLFPAAAAAVASPLSKLYKLVQLGKEGQDNDDDDDEEEDAFDELLDDKLPCDFGKQQGVLVSPSTSLPPIIRAGA